MGYFKLNYFKFKLDACSDWQGIGMGWWFGLDGLNGPCPLYDYRSVALSQSDVYESH